MRTYVRQNKILVFLVKKLTKIRVVNVFLFLRISHYYVKQFQIVNIAHIVLKAEDVYLSQDLVCFVPILLNPLNALIGMDQTFSQNGIKILFLLPPRLLKKALLAVVAHSLERIADGALVLLVSVLNSDIFNC